MDTHDSIKVLLEQMIHLGASDLHLKVGSPPFARVNAELVPLGASVLSPEKIRGFASELMPPVKAKEFEKTMEVDFAYTAPGIGRFRTNIFLQRSSVSIVMRFVKTEIPEFYDLNLPSCLENFCQQDRGLVLVTGSTNSGKSTTLAAMISYMNKNFRRHIITIEDPIEYLHHDNLSIINQREVGIDTDSFGEALRHVLRQDPDVILVGEMRDADSFSAALQAAETGHLVLSTVHASSASNTIDRILDFFREPVVCDQARFQLANNLVAIISQRLIPTKDGEGLVPAVEILTGTPTVKKLIRENNLKKLPQVIASGQDVEMISFNQSLLKLIQNGMISEDIGLSYATNPEALKMNLQGIFLDEGRKILN